MQLRPWAEQKTDRQREQGAGRKEFRLVESRLLCSPKQDESTLLMLRFR